MRTRLVRATCAAVLIALLVPAAVARAEIPPDKVDPALRSRMLADPLALLPVIVEMQPPSRPFVGVPTIARANEAMDLLRLNGRAIGALSLVNGAAGIANAAGIEAINLVPTVAYVHYDATVGPRRPSSPISPSSSPPPSGTTSTVAPATGASLGAVYPRVINADQLWDQGVTGRGVTVAVLDSGVAPDLDLVSPTNRILASVNFAGDRLMVDPGGHGTHIAGTIAGNGTRSAGEFTGIAPGANIVDVRVLNSLGGGRVSSFVRGMEWVVAHRAAYNIRVVNMSFGAPPRTSYRTDPFSAAVETAWRMGLVIVVASGNAGPARDSVLTPGIDPYVITVGATDDGGTADRGDDVLAWFSSWGSSGGYAKPDLVAPGRRIVAPRVAGSTLDTLFPDRIVTAANGATYFRLSGTSMSTAVVSGAVALLLEKRPTLGPDQVKAVLTARTQTYGESSGVAPPDPIATGAGLLDAFAATMGTPNAPQSAQTTPLGLAGTVSAQVASPAAPTYTFVLPPPANRALRPADTFARSVYAFLQTVPLRWKDPTLGGIPWATLTWDSVGWDSVAWDNFDWDSVAWDSVGWDSVAWDSVAWDSVGWDSVGWDSVGWDAFNFD
ncbi:MAG TPA: S8 family peptidase [Candidatus Limnocylindria bacterium]|nr:S8 family peptidase [Candidatus Limnocylindria bacterium]